MANSLLPIAYYLLAARDFAPALKFFFTFFAEGLFADTTRSFATEEFASISAESSR